MSELEFEYIRYTTLKNIKKNFLQNCNLHSNEAIKVWANWVIVNRIQHQQIDDFLPTEKLELDNKTVSLLIEKGIDEETAINFYHDFMQQCHRWKFRYQYYKPDDLVSDKVSDKISISSIDDETTIEYRGIAHHIDTKAVERILKSYKGSNYKFSLWKLLNTYALLDGLSYQWSLPPETFSFLRDNCNLSTELFASPLNHHLSNYFSLFNIDHEFGSSGDFFKSTWKHFQNGGIYEANPPFIESVFIKASQMIISYLKHAKSNMVDLAFIFIMPDWLDSFAYKCLKSSLYIKKEVILRKGQHKYWEYRKNRLIQANFNTHVIILSSTESYFRKFWSDKLEEMFIKTMSLSPPPLS